MLDNQVSLVSDVLERYGSDWRGVARHARLLSSLDPDAAEELTAAVALGVAPPKERDVSQSPCFCHQCRQDWPRWQVVQGICRACRAKRSGGRPE